MSEDSIAKLGIINSGESFSLGAAVQLKDRDGKVFLLNQSEQLQVNGSYFSNGIQKNASINHAFLNYNSEMKGFAFVEIKITGEPGTDGFLVLAYKDLVLKTAIKF